LVEPDSNAKSMVVADVDVRSVEGSINALEALVASTARGGNEDVTTAVGDPDQELRLVTWALTCTHADVPCLPQKRFRMLAKQGLYLLDVRMRRWV
jgi:hypothetical protein